MEIFALYLENLEHCMNKNKEFFFLFFLKVLCRKGRNSNITVPQIYRKTNSIQHTWFCSSTKVPLLSVFRSNLKHSNVNTSYFREKINYYLPRGLDIVTPLALHCSADADADAYSLATRTWKYAGWLGSGSTMLALLSIATTSVMVGLSTAFSCTHNNALLMHLIIISNA